MFVRVSSTCQSADVFTGVVFAQALLLCDVGHGHIQAETVFIGWLEDKNKPHLKHPLDEHKKYTIHCLQMYRFRLN